MTSHFANIYHFGDIFNRFKSPNNVVSLLVLAQMGKVMNFFMEKIRGTEIAEKDDVH